jgi:hypothetical protein
MGSSMTGAQVEPAQTWIDNAIVAHGTAINFKLQNGSDFSYLLASDGTILARASDTDFFPTGRSVLYGNYREVAGVRVFSPYRAGQNGEITEDYRVIEVQVNPPLSDALDLLHKSVSA